MTASFLVYEFKSGHISMRYGRLWVVAFFFDELAFVPFQRLVVIANVRMPQYHKILFPFVSARIF